MSRRGKRGIAAFSEKYRPKNITIEFDVNGVPVGKNEPQFMSWFGIERRTRLPYYLEMKEIDKNHGLLFDQLWLYTTDYWDIADDRGKKVMKRKATNIMRKFRSTLVTNFVKKGRTPHDKYSFVGKKEWAAFVRKTTSEDFVEKGNKATLNARKNKDPSRLGRATFANLVYDDKWLSKWNQLVEKNPILGCIQNKRSKLWIVSRARQNIETGVKEITTEMQGRLQDLVEKEREREMLANGTYYVPGKDPITEVMGAEHGGSTRMYSQVVGASKALGWLNGGGKEKVLEDPPNYNAIKTPIQTEALEEVRQETETIRGDLARIEAAQGSGVRGSSCASGRSHNDFEDIEVLSKCDLLWPYSRTETMIGQGLVYPTRDRILHGRTMTPCFVKVQVDTVEKKFWDVPVPPELETDELFVFRDAVTQFIQWPRKLIRLQDTMSPHNSMTGPIDILPLHD